MNLQIAICFLNFIFTAFSADESYLHWLVNERDYCGGLSSDCAFLSLSFKAVSRIFKTDSLTMRDRCSLAKASRNSPKIQNEERQIALQAMSRNIQEAIFPKRSNDDFFTCSEMNNDGELTLTFTEGDIDITLDLEKTSHNFMLKFRFPISLTRHSMESFRLIVSNPDGDDDDFENERQLAFDFENNRVFISTGWTWDEHEIVLFSRPFSTENQILWVFPQKGELYFLGEPIPIRGKELRWETYSVNDNPVVHIQYAPIWEK